MEKAGGLYLYNDITIFCNNFFFLLFEYLHGCIGKEKRREKYLCVSNIFVFFFMLVICIAHRTIYTASSWCYAFCSSSSLYISLAIYLPFPLYTDEQKFYKKTFSANYPNVKKQTTI